MWLAVYCIIIAYIGAQEWYNDDRITEWSSEDTEKMYLLSRDNLELVMVPFELECRWAQNSKLHFIMSPRQSH